MGTKLDDLVKKINRDAKDEIMSLGQLEYNYERIPFTSPRMNYCTYGGIPKYKITEFYGEEHGGKTTSALDIVANYQHMGEPDGSVLWIDAENTLDRQWAEKLGVDMSRVYLVQPKNQSAEDIFEIIEEAVKTGEVGLWVLDSIGILASSAELDPKKDYEDKTYGGISLPLTRFSKKIEMYMTKYLCTGIGINQLRDNLGSSWGGSKTTGGKAWKHACMVRLEFRKGSYLDDRGNVLPTTAENPAGNIVLMTMKKNKSCKPDRRTGSYTINYEFGINYIFDLTDVCIKYDVIQQAGSWFTIVDPKTGEVIRDKLHGQSALYETLETDEELLVKVENMIDSYMKI